MSSASPTSPPASSRSRRRPTPTAPAYATFTFQVQDDGGTANGGVDLDPDREHASPSTSPRSTTRRRRTDNTVSDQRGRGLHLRRAPTSASPIRPTARPNALAGGEDHHPARRRHADRLNGAAVDRRPVDPGRRHQRASWRSRRPRTPTAPATPASPSRCRTTAARPTAASISIRRPHTITINVTAVNDAPVGTNNTVTRDRRHARYTFTAADFGFTDPNDSRGQCAAAVKITDAARRRARST